MVSAPPKLARTSSVMFWLLVFSQVPVSPQACVPQNPGVRQISLVTHEPLSVKTQPRTGSQVSVVQVLLSSHGAFGVKTQPVAGTQESDVHALLSLHTSGVPGLQPETVSVAAVNCTVFGVELQPLGEPLQVSETVTEAWSFKGVGSVKTVV